jgi:X-Pro dipeptidyl-peptidase (S15 family)
MGNIVAEEVHNVSQPERLRGESLSKANSNAVARGEPPSAGGFSDSSARLARFTSRGSGSGPYNPVEIRASGRILVTVLVLLTSIYGRAQQPYAITIERNTSLKMRDGVVLHADIYRPAGPEKFPVLLERTPYNKDSLIGFAAGAAAHGYIVIIQDVRGRYTSEGEWYPFKYESQDGFETVEWAGSLPTPTEKLGWRGARTWERLKCWRPSRSRPIWRGFAQLSPQATITTGGPIRAAPSSSGSTNRGPHRWPKTP